MAWSSPWGWRRAGSRSRSSWRSSARWGDSPEPDRLRRERLYTSFFRGTPLLVQLFLFYLALPRLGINLTARFPDLPGGLVDILTRPVFQVGVLVLGLNYGAYMTEIFRAGIQSVSHGQSEAADALGMTYRHKMRRVVLPQAFRVIIPPTGNEFIAMMKDTARLGPRSIDRIDGVERSSSGTRM